MILIADTSGLIASSDQRSPTATDCREALNSAGTVIVSPLVLAEVDHLARKRFGAAGRTAMIAAIREQAHHRRFQIPEITVSLLDIAQTVQHRYSALDLDLADAVNVTLASHYRTDAVLTLDYRDFRAIQPLTAHPAFRLYPADAPA